MGGFSSSGSCRFDIASSTALFVRQYILFLLAVCKPVALRKMIDVGLLPGTVMRHAIGYVSQLAVFYVIMRLSCIGDIDNEASSPILS